MELSERLSLRLAIEPLDRFATCFLNRADQALALAREVEPNPVSLSMHVI